MHCFLDLTNRTGQQFSPRGLPLLWPLSQRLISCPIVILPGVAVGLKSFDPVNLLGIASEILLFGCLIGFVLLARSLLENHP